jgi:hypothetical protein
MRGASALLNLQYVSIARSLTESKNAALCLAEEQCSKLLFGMFSVRISARTPAILNEVLLDLILSPSNQTLGHYLKPEITASFQNPFQVNIHQHLATMRYIGIV